VRLLALALVTFVVPAGALAQQGGAHGRLETDLVLEGSLGGGAVVVGDQWTGAVVAEGRARYLGMAGLFLGTEVRARPDTGDAAGRLFIGADLRPVFFARFLLGATLNDRYWDFFFDSIGLDLGVAITPLDEDIGAALAVGFGFDVPLVFFDEPTHQSPDGVSLRFFARHVAALASDRGGPNGGVNDWLMGATLVVRGSVRSGLPTWEPRRYELP